MEAGAQVGDDGDVLAIQFVLYYALFFFWLLLLARIVAEMVRSFARQWVPAGSRCGCWPAVDSGLLRSTQRATASPLPHLTSPMIRDRCLAGTSTPSDTAVNC